MKKSLLVIVIAFVCCSLFGEAYKITNVNYNITAAGFNFLGKTKPYALEYNVPIDKKTVFSSKEELYKYLAEYERDLINLRAFASIEILSPAFGSLQDLHNIYKNDTDNQLETINDETSLPINNVMEVSETYELNPIMDIDSNDINYETIPEIELLESEQENSDEITEVELTLNLKDTHHMLIVPFVFKVDSNRGWNPKIKAKDKNFLGTLNTMDTYLDATVPFANSDYDAELGVGFSFDYPFTMGPLFASWINDYSFDYNFTEKAPEFSAKTGFNISYPLDRITFSLDLYQYADRNIDYLKYGDDIFFREYAQFSMPVTLFKIPNWGNISYSPFVNYTFTWDKDELTYSGLHYSTLRWGHSISTRRVNWDEQFRKGASFNLSNTYCTYVVGNKVEATISAEIKAYYNWKLFPIDFLDRLGVAVDLYAYHSFDTPTSDQITFGNRLRGCRDLAYFAVETGYNGYYRHQSPTAFVMNIDLPFHLFTLEFNNRIMSIFNCNVQLSPFFDFALCENLVTKKLFDPKDGFYCAGLEVLVYPLKFSSYEVRASVGVDLGRTILEDYVNTDWRLNGSKFEYSLGIGLHY